MKAKVLWVESAYAQLEALSLDLAVEIFNKTAILESFPEAGPPLLYKGLETYRQLIIKPDYRVVYRYIPEKNEVLILAAQHCRQKLPSPRELRRREET